MTSLGNDAEVTFTCDRCGAKTKKQLAWLKSNPEFVCACGVVHALNPDQFREIGRQLDEQAAAFNRGINMLGKGK